MFNDKVQAKALILSFIAYIVVSVVASIVLVQVWLPAGASAEESAKLAQTDHAVLMGELIIGTVLGIAAGWLACHLSGAIGLKNSLVLGGLFIIYAGVGIALNSEAPLWKHALHLLAPIPISLAGGYLKLRSARGVAASHA